MEFSTRGFRGVQGVLTRLQTSLTSFSSSASGAMARFTQVGGGLRNVLLGIGAVGALRFVINQSIQAENATEGLKAALAATGQEVTQNAAMIDRWASSLSRKISMDDEEIVKLTEFATALGVNAERVRELTSLGLGLARSFRVDPAHTVKALSIALQGGGFGRLRALIPDFQDLTEAQVNFIVASRGATGLKLLAADAQTLGGQLKGLLVEFGNLTEALQVGDTVKTLTGYLSQLVGWLQTLSPETKRFAGQVLLVGAGITALSFVLSPLLGILAALGPLLTGLVTGGLAGLITGVQFLIANPLAFIFLAAAGALAAMWVQGRRVSNEMDELINKMGKLNELVTRKEFLQLSTTIGTPQALLGAAEKNPEKVTQSIRSELTRLSGRQQAARAELREREGFGFASMQDFLNEKVTGASRQTELLKQIAEDDTQVQILQATLGEIKGLKAFTFKGKSEPQIEVPKIELPDFSKLVFPTGKDEKAKKDDTAKQFKAESLGPLELARKLQAAALDRGDKKLDEQINNQRQQIALHLETNRLLNRSPQPRPGFTEEPSGLLRMDRVKPVGPVARPPARGGIQPGFTEEPSGLLRFDRAGRAHQAGEAKHIQKLEELKRKADQQLAKQQIQVDALKEIAKNTAKGQTATVGA